MVQMLVPIFKQLCLVVQGNDVGEVSSALLMEGSNAACVTVVVAQFIGGGGVAAVTVALQQSNDRENWRAIDSMEPLEIFECGSYRMEYTSIGAAAVRVAASSQANGHDINVVIAVDVSLARL